MNRVRFELAVLALAVVCPFGCDKDGGVAAVVVTSPDECAADPAAPVVVEVEFDTDRGITRVSWEDSDGDVIGEGALRVDGTQCLISPETDADGNPLEGTCHFFGSNLTLTCPTAGWVGSWADCPSGASVELIDSSGNSGMGTCP